MFSKKIAYSARFLKMPSDSQLLYFHLGLHADDDGIVEAYPIMKLLGSNEDNLRVLVAKGLIKVLNEDLVSFITDWQEHNLIRADRKVDSIYKHLLLQIVPDVELLEPKPRADTGVIPKQLTGRPVDGISKDKLSQVKLSKDNIPPQAVEDNKNITKQIVNYFFELKGWDNKDKPFYKENKIIYARFTRPAKELLELCENNAEEAKNCLKKVGDWAKSRDLDWSIETVFKKWYDIDILKPKEKKPYIDGLKAFQKVEGGKWYVISKDGEIREYGATPKEIIYK